MRDSPTNIYASPLAGYRSTCRTCPHIPFTPMRISVGCYAITIWLSLFKLNITFLRDKGKQSRRNGKGGWFRMVAAFLHTISPHATLSSHGGWFGYCLWAGAYSSPALHGRLFISVGLVDVFPNVCGQWAAGKSLVFNLLVTGKATSFTGAVY